MPSLARTSRSWVAALSAGRFATIVELLPPKGYVGDEIIERRAR